MPAAQQKFVEQRKTAEITGRGVDANGSKLEGVPDGVISEEGEDVGREVQHHQMSGIFLAHQSAGEERESGLHEEDQVTRIEGPGEVGGDAEVPDIVGEFDGQRLLGGLRLIVVKIFLVLCKIGSVLVGRFRDDKGIARGVGSGRAVAGCHAGWISLRGLVRKT